MLFDRMLYQAPGVQNINAEPARSSIFSFASEAAALAAAGSADHGKRVISLDGKWFFRYTENPDALTMADLTCDLKDQAQINVPGAWTMQGYDKPHYTNVQMPYSDIAPQVPKCNPTGIYQRSFVLDKAQLQSRLLLHFEGVESFFAVLVNDQFAGAAKDSRATREFDVTHYCREGENRLTVVVSKWSDSNFIEDQDMWWHGGIVRSVYLLTLPENHIADIFAAATLDDTYQNGRLELKGALHLKNQPKEEDQWRIEFNLYDPAGKAVKGFPQQLDFLPYAADANYMVSVEGHGALPVLDIPNVKPWSAEQPNLYKLSAALIDPSGNRIDYTAVRIGFRSVKISERKLLINGEPVLFCGVNRHESHPEKGRSVDRSDIERDLKLMKQFNINAIRTSHYPDCTDFYDLCDEYGFYVWDEANLEHHAYYFSFCSNPAWAGSFMDRTVDMVERDKNHPAVIVWSLGNESGVGANHAAMAGYVRYRDPSRLLNFEGAINRPYNLTEPMRNISLTDIVSPMYSPVENLYRWSRIARHDPRPYIMCEFSHAMGNSNGELADYFEAFEQCDGLQGGFIWEWCDHALYKTDADGKKYLAYGGDFGDEPNDGNFVCDGLVGAERDVHPGLYEYKYLAQKVKFYARDLANNIFEVENRRYFSDLSDLQIKVTYTVDGSAVKNMIVPMPAVEKSYKSRAILKLDAVDLTAYCGKKAHVLLQAVLKKSCRWAEKGFEVAHEQFALPAVLPVKRVKVSKYPVSIAENPDDITVNVNDLSVQICRSNGIMLWQRSGRTVAIAGAEPWFFRAPTDNDGFRLPGLNNTCRPIRQWLDKQYDKFILQSCEVSLQDNSINIMRQFGTAALAGSIKVNMQLTARDNGSVELDTTFEVPEEFVDLPRVGLRWQLPQSFSTVEYLGMGPLENYRDRVSAACYGRYAENIAALGGTYLLPQSAGNRTGVEELTVRGGGSTLTIRSAGTMEFSILPYSDQELFAARHWHELPQQNCWYLYTDAIQRGVGTRSCGPELADRYRIKTGVYNLKLNLF